MALAHLLATDGTDDYVQLAAPVTISAGQTYRLEADIECSDNDAFGVRLLGQSGSDTNRIIIFDGLAANIVATLLGTKSSGLQVDVLDRHNWAFYRDNTTTNKVSVDNVESPTAINENSGGMTFNWLLTQRTATNARNAVNLYRMKLWLDGVLAHDWNPSNRTLGATTLVDEVGGNHGTLVNGGTFVEYDDGTGGGGTSEIIGSAASTASAEPITFKSGKILSLQPAAATSSSSLMNFTKPYFVGIATAGANVNATGVTFLLNHGTQLDTAESVSYGSDMQFTYGATSYSVTMDSASLDTIASTIVFKRSASATLDPATTTSLATAQTYRLDYRYLVEPGSIDVAGSAVDFTYDSSGYTLNVEPGALSSDASAVNLKWAYRFTLDSAGLNATGSNLGFVYPIMNTLRLTAFTVQFKDSSISAQFKQGHVDAAFKTSVVSVRFNQGEL